MKKTLMTLTVLGVLFGTSQAFAGASANVGVTSNYLWRGLQQTADDPALQAGLDYAADNGLYVGTWASNTRFAGVGGTELDLYGGYKKELKGGLSYDVGAVKYHYPNDNSNDFSEAYTKLGYKGVGFEYDNTIQTDDETINAKGDQYYSLGYTGELKNDWSYGAKMGRYDFKNNTDYNHGQLSLTKGMKKVGDVTFALDKTSKAGATYNGDDDLRASVSWKKAFDF